MAIKTTRFSGADWADQLHEIILVGAGGIGSWTALNLARIGHHLHIVDHDLVDETNVEGGQMYHRFDVNKNKAAAVVQTCRSMGATSQLEAYGVKYTADLGCTDIMITGLDNMDARALVFESWLDHVNSKATEAEKAKCLLIDGRLTMEMFEVLAVQGNRADQIAVYKEKYLFSSEEANKVECTTKQSSFAAMGIASFMTATLCNWLANQKMGMADYKEVPLYTRMFYPCMQHLTTA